jgi:hypothetical protein
VFVRTTEFTFCWGTMTFIISAINKAYRGGGYSREKQHVIQKYFSPRVIQEKFTLMAGQGDTC